MSNLNDIFFTPAANQELTYDQVLEDVQRYFAENHASTIAEAGEGNAERATSLLKELMEHYIVKRKYALDGLSTKELCSKLYEDMAGYSTINAFFRVVHRNRHLFDFGVLNLLKSSTTNGRTSNLHQNFRIH